MRGKSIYLPLEVVNQQLYNLEGTTFLNLQVILHPINPKRDIARKLLVDVIGGGPHSLVGAISDFR